MYKMTDFGSGLLVLLGVLLWCCSVIVRRSRGAVFVIVSTALILGVSFNLLMLASMFFVSSHAQLGMLIGLSLHKTSIFLVDGMIIGWAIVSIFRSKLNHFLCQMPWERIIRLLRLVMSTYFLFTGIGKIVNYDGMLSFFHSSGYGALMLDFILCLEMSCAIGLLFNVSVIPATVLLIADMLGATYTHYHNFLVSGTPEPFSNSIDSLKMLPFLLVIIFASVYAQRLAKRGAAEKVRSGKDR